MPLHRAESVCARMCVFIYNECQQCWRNVRELVLMYILMSTCVCVCVSVSKLQSFPGEK